MAKFKVGDTIRWKGDRDMDPYNITDISEREKVYITDRISIPFELEHQYEIVSKDDRVNHPSHYTWLKEKCGIEVIDITRHMDFDLGNVVKYVLRQGHKSEEGMSDKAKAIEDLKKARWYLDDKIKMLEEKL